MRNVPYVTFCKTNPALVIGRKVWLKGLVLVSLLILCNYFWLFLACLDQMLYYTINVLYWYMYAVSFTVSFRAVSHQYSTQYSSKTPSWLPHHKDSLLALWRKRKYSSSHCEFWLIVWKNEGPSGDSNAWMLDRQTLLLLAD